ncbi:hypothetical protein WJX73_006338 [Symbiochloris irregularis]|uniref:Uncharacterized protein n=1 Tax=Symbiochloris irregularis TaxID=706552 RepID=A0AAW1P052_9CHLO
MANKIEQRDKGLPAERPDFSGYWRQVKHENFDNFLRELGFPWAVRKMMLKYGSQSTDIIKHSGNSLRITTVNAKASWTRDVAEGREVSQRNALGEAVKVAGAWEGSVHKTTMEGGSGARVMTWRFMDAGLMVVRTCVQLPNGRETSMFWYLEAIDDPDLQPSSLSGAQALAKSRKAIMRAQKCVMRATVKDNENLQRLAKNMSKWDTPADHLPHPMATDKDNKELYAAMLRSSSPPSSSMSPTSASPRASFHMPNHPAFIADMRRNSRGEISAASATRAGSDDEDTHASEGASRTNLSNLPSEAYAPVEATSALRRPSAQGSHDSGVPSMANGGAIDGGPLVAPLHKRLASTDHFPEQSSTRSTKALEAVLSARLQEYSENRSIANVIPLDNPLASDEPELLSMSPEQAEATQLKLAELEREVRKVTQQRARHAQGRECGCCTVVFHRSVIPPAVRVWDL